MWPITGLMAGRRHNSRLMEPNTPRFCPEMKTRRENRRIVAADNRDHLSRREKPANRGFTTSGSTTEMARQYTSAATIPERSPNVLKNFTF